MYQQADEEIYHESKDVWILAEEHDRLLLQNHTINFIEWIFIK
jgi:hypothetical protein